MIFALTFATALLASVGMSDAALRGNNDANLQGWTPKGEYEALKDWNKEALDGRQLQAFTNLGECFEETGSAALCSCIFLDGNTLEYCGYCGNALVAAQFSLSDTSRFGEWFTNDSVLNLAQTGSYKGIAGITEYVNFIYSVFFDSYDLLGAPAVKFFPNPDFAVDGTCIVAFTSNRRVGLNADLYSDTCYKTTVGSTISYTATTPENGHIDVVKADVWYPEAYLESVFGSMIEDNALEWLCGIVETHCPATWVYNNFDNNPQKCVNNYSALPKAEGDRQHVDGKSLGCKLLHATFVPLNDYHCAHTSFKKQEDPSGIVKCQKSYGVTPEDLFSTEMLDWFATVGVSQYGYDPELLYDGSQSAC